MGEPCDVSSPRVETDLAPRRGIPERFKDSDRLAIGLRTDYKLAAVPVSKVVEESLQREYPTGRFASFNTEPLDEIGGCPEVREQFLDRVRGVDTVVGVVGSRRVCAKYYTCDEIIAEELDKPFVTVCSNGFVPNEKAASSGKGMPAARITSSLLSSIAPRLQSGKGCSALVFCKHTFSTSPNHQRLPRPRTVSRQASKHLVGGIK